MYFYTKIETIKLEDWIKEAKEIRKKDLATCAINSINYEKSLIDLIERLNEIIRKNKLPSKLSNNIILVGNVKELLKEGGLTKSDINNIILSAKKDVQSGIVDLEVKQEYFAKDCDIDPKDIKFEQKTFEINTIDDLKYLKDYLVEYEYEYRKKIFDKSRKI